MDRVFDTMQLPETPDVIAPDGSDVRVLLQLGRGSMAHFELGAGRVSRAVAHHSVDEIWYILDGHGRMWRRQAGRQETVLLRAGTCVSIPAGTHFQFRAGQGGIVTPTAASGPPGPARNWKCVPAGMDTQVPARNGTVSCRSAWRRHIWPSPCRTYQISSTEWWATGRETRPAPSSKCAIEPGPS